MRFVVRWLYVTMRNYRVDYTSLYGSSCDDYTSLCGIAGWTICHYAELQNGLYVIMRNFKMNYTSLRGIAKWTIRHCAVYAETATTRK